MEDIMLIGRAVGRLLLLSLLVPLSEPGVAATASFPIELRSVWDPSRPCDLNGTTDRDSRFEITAKQRLNYEEIEEIGSAELLADTPKTWRIVTVSDVGPENLAQPWIYVLEGDLLAVNDGQSARMYTRCR